MEEAIKAVEMYRTVLNSGDIEQINAWISEDFIGYFGYYKDKKYEIYDSTTYKADNIETFKLYIGKNPFWHYQDLTKNMRTHNELILSSIVDFFLMDEKVATVLAIEVFRKEKGEWKLLRQHMERYASI